MKIKKKKKPDTIYDHPLNQIVDMFPDGGFTDPRTDSYYTPSSSDKKWNIEQDKARNIGKTSMLHEVNIIAPRAQYPTELGKRLQYSRDENQKIKDAAAEERWSNSYKGEEGLGNDLIGEQIGIGALLKGAFAIKSITSELKEIRKNVVNNTWRLNPYAFKPNPNMLYRGLGKEGFDDALQTGVFRPKQYDLPKNETFREILNRPKDFKSTFYSPDFEAASRYGNGFIAEVPKDAANFAKRYGRKDWSVHTGEQIPIEKGKLFERDWLRRYKEVQVDKVNKPQYLLEDRKILKETKPYNYIEQDNSPIAMKQRYEEELRRNKEIAEASKKYTRTEIKLKDEIELEKSLKDLKNKKEDLEYGGFIERKSKSGRVFKYKKYNNK